MINEHKKIANRVRDLVSKSREGDEFVGFLGNLNGVVEADKYGNVHVLIHGIEFTAYNEKVPKIAFLPVRLSKRAGRLYVTEARNVFHRAAYVNLPDHDHTWGRSTNPTWVRGEQFLPGLVIPHDSGLSVHFTGLIYWLDGDFRICTAQDVDLSGEIPASGALFALLEADKDGVITLNTGAAVDARGMLTYADIPEPGAGMKSLNFAIKLYAGQSRIQQGLDFATSDVVDLRWAGFGAAGGGGTPAGDDREIQFNDDGAFGASATFKRNSDGSITIGTPIAEPTPNPYDIMQGATGTSAAHFIESFGADVASYITFLRARGTHTSAEAVLTNDVLGRIRARGHDGAGVPATRAEIRFVANADWDTDDHATRIEIWTTPDEETEQELIATIDEDGINLVSGKEYRIDGVQHTHTADDITNGATLPASNSNDIFRVDNAGSSIFTATINGTPSGTSVVYTQTGGNDQFLVPFSTSQLGKLRLYNTTRGNHALISNCNITTDTITLTANAPANWANGDTITITSQTVVSAQNHVDIEITSGEFLDASLGFIWWAQIDASSLAGITFRTHPFETYSASKNQNFSLTTGNSTFVKLVSNVFSIAVIQTAPASGNLLAIRQVAVVK